jgi:hypothetical protein
MATQIRTETLLITPPIQPFKLRYAVIEAIQSEGGRERFAISYTSEHSLRGLVAAACIVETGFLSREEAVAACGTSMPLAA